MYALVLRHSTFLIYGWVGGHVKGTVGPPSSDLTHIKEVLCRGTRAYIKALPCQFWCQFDQ